MRPGDVPTFQALNDTEAGVLTIYGEARGEPFTGKQAVGQVIANRAEKQKKTIKEIVYAPNQFSCYLGTDPNYKTLFQIAMEFGPYLDVHPLLQECSRAWTEDCPDVVKELDGATFYRVHGTINKWFDGAVHDQRLIYTVTIGAHEFFKEKG